MIRQLFIYLGPNAPDEVHWAATNGSGKLLTGKGPLAEVPRAAGERLVVLVAGSDVLITEAAMPGGRKRLLRQSLPFLLEENLAGEVEESHFAAGPFSPGGKATVAVVGRARLVEWLAMLSEAGLHPAVLTPATLAVPLSADAWTLVITEDGFLARQDNWRVFAGEIANLNHYLRSEASPAAGAGDNPNLQIINCTGRDFSLPTAGFNPSPIRPAQLMKVLVDGFTSGPHINLLQGEFAGNAHWRETLRHWQVAIAAAVALFALLGADSTFDYFRLKNESARLNREIIATFQKAFPDTHRVVNARAQMEQKLRELRGNIRQNNFFALYDKVAPLLDATAPAGLEIIRFREGRLELDLNLTSLEALEKLKDDLSRAPGIATEIRNAETTGGRVRARLSLEVKS